MKTEHLVKDREHGCPFGHKCDDCNLYIPLYQTHSDGEVTAKYNCSFNSALVLSSELKEGVLRVQSSTESFRNEMVKGQKQTAQLLAISAKQALAQLKHDGRILEEDT